MSFILNKLETNFQNLEESYKLLQKKLKENSNVGVKNIDLLNLLISNANKMTLEIDNLTLNLQNESKSNSNEINEKITELEIQDKILKKLLPYYFLIDNSIRTESK